MSGVVTVVVGVVDVLRVAVVGVVGDDAVDGVLDGAVAVECVVCVGVSVVLSVVVITDGACELLATGGVLTTGVVGPEFRWMTATTPTMIPAVIASTSRVIAKVRPALGFGFWSGRGGSTGTGCGRVAVAGGAAITSVFPVRAASTCAAVGRRAGSACVMVRSSAGHDPGRLSGTIGSRSSRATADSTARPGYSRWPVRHSSSTRPSA